MLVCENFSPYEMIRESTGYVHYCCHGRPFTLFTVDTTDPGRTVTGVALVAMVCVERRGEGEAATVLPGCMTVPSGGRTVWEVTADCAVLVGIAWVTVEEASLAFFGQPLVEPFLFPF